MHRRRGIIARWRLTVVQEITAPAKGPSFAYYLSRVSRPSYFCRTMIRWYNRVATAALGSESREGFGNVSCSPPLPQVPLNGRVHLRSG